uniref:Transmembrane protein n=1 Tax=Caenorhabditis tropicalis TaxID=1561998 RepID=A0A1I7T2B5_9PELO
MSTSDADSTVCIINSTLPKYQVNISKLFQNILSSFSQTSSCAHRALLVVQDVASLLAVKMTSLSVRLKQSLPFFILWLIIFGIAYMVHLFFEDDETGKPVNKKKPLDGKLELLLPIENDYTVEDPVFGKLYEDQVPKLATIPKKRR